MDELMSFDDFARVFGKLPEWEREISEHAAEIGPIDIEFTDGSSVTVNQ